MYTSVPPKARRFSFLAYPPDDDDDADAVGDEDEDPGRLVVLSSRLIILGILLRRKIVETIAKEVTILNETT